MEAKGVALWQRVFGDGSLKEAAFLRKGNANVRGDVQKSSLGESDRDQGADSVDFDTVLSPLSIF